MSASKSTEGKRRGRTKRTKLTAENLDAEVAALRDLDLGALRERWLGLFRSEAPGHLPKWLLLRIVAYRMQANVLGDLDRETVRYLQEVAAERDKRRASGEIRGRKKPPPVPPVGAAIRRLKPGTVLVREYDKVLHHVMVVQDGFSWNGSTYGSLSEAAFAITGTRWNGPRFFGLRAEAKPASGSAKRVAAR